MTDLRFDTSDFLRHLDTSERNVAKAMEDTVDDSTDDLLRIARDIAPISASQLRRSVDKKVKWKNGKIVGEVWFNATENSSGYGRFNYALWTHEAEYKLGPISEQAPGTDGYEVGNKYLERPLKGESEKYFRWMAEEVLRVLD